MVLSTEPGDGPVAVSVYPWEIALEPAGSERHGSAQNHLAVEVVSVTAVGNRVRVGLAAPQPLVAELSDASAQRARARARRAGRGDVEGGGHAAAATVTQQEERMKLSARNQLSGTVTSVNEGAAIANVELDVNGPAARRLDHRRGRAGARPGGGHGGHGDRQGVGRDPGRGLGAPNQRRSRCVAPFVAGLSRECCCGTRRTSASSCSARAGDERAFVDDRRALPGAAAALLPAGSCPGAAAEDAVQQTFINAYRALSSDAGQAPVALRPWLYRVARNAALNVARDPQAELDELPESLDGVRRPDEVVQARERFQRVVGAVNQLPPKQRQVIVRHALDGESHERIASDLGMSAGSIRQLVHRARRTVREAAAALLPTPLLRFLPLGADAAEVGSGAALAKVAVAVVVVGAAGGGAAGVVKHEADKPAVAETRKAPERPAARKAPAVTVARARAWWRARRARAPSGNGSSGSGKGSSGKGSSGSSDTGSSGSSGSGSSGGPRVRPARVRRLGFVRLGLVRLGFVRLRARPAVGSSGSGRPARARRGRARPAPARPGRALRARVRPARARPASGSSGVGLVGVGLFRLWLVRQRFLRLGLFRFGLG